MLTFGGRFLEEFLPKTFLSIFQNILKLPTNDERHVQSSLLHTLKTRNIKIYFRKTRHEQKIYPPSPSINSDRFRNQQTGKHGVEDRSVGCESRGF